jgi:carbonic anhydrase
MYEVVWQYDETAPFEEALPANAVEARQHLIAGNLDFAGLFSPGRPAREPSRRVVRVTPRNVGIGRVPGEAPAQEPFAAVLGCADARAPVELIFGQHVNDLFVVRVAGNLLGEEILGSLAYVVEHLSTLRLVVALGHTGCGAVTAGVDAYLSSTAHLDPSGSPSLRAIVNNLMAPARGAVLALAAIYGDSVTTLAGYRRALIETAVVLNAAMSAAQLVHHFHDALSERLQVSFGVYDLIGRKVGLPADAPGDGWQVGLFEPPTDAAEISALARRVADSAFIRRLLTDDNKVTAGSERSGHFSPQ